jgi:hypothetical protein
MVLRQKLASSPRIPTRLCKDSTEVVSLIDRIFKDVAAEKQPLAEFQIAKKINAEKPRSSLVRLGVLSRMRLS